MDRVIEVTSTGYIFPEADKRAIGQTSPPTKEIPFHIMDTIVDLDLNANALQDLLFMRKIAKSGQEYKWANVEDLVGVDISGWKLYTFEYDQAYEYSGWSVIGISKTFKLFEDAFATDLVHVTMLGDERTWEYGRNILLVRYTPEELTAALTDAGEEKARAEEYEAKEQAEAELDEQEREFREENFNNIDWVRELRV